MSEVKALPTIEELMEVNDDLSTMSRKALLKIVKAEGHDIAEEDIMTNWTPNEARARIRLARIQKGMMAWGEDKQEQASDWKLEIPVIQAHQLGRDCFVGTIKYRDLDKIEVDADVQRPEVARRIPQIAKYVLDNDGYFGAALLTITGPVMLDENRLIVDHECRIVVNDGQHRIAGIRRAIEDDPDAMQERLDDDLPVVIYVDLSREEQRQLFADLNLNAAKPPKAIGLSYNDRNTAVKIAKRLIEKCACFRGKVNYLKTRIGKRDPELFTFSIIVDIVQAMFDDLMPDMTVDEIERRADAAAAFWRQVDEVMGPHFEARNYSINKNALVAIAKLYGFETINWQKLGELDWSLDGDLSRVASMAGGTNAAIRALKEEIARLVVE